MCVPLGNTLTSDGVEPRRIGNGLSRCFYFNFLADWLGLVRRFKFAFAVAKFMDHLYANSAKKN